MEISFTKMQGCGNDFIFLDCLNKDIPNLGAIAGKLCDRRFGIGADQLLTIHPSKVADFKMEIYNADGSQVEMCGNGMRTFAKYVVEEGLIKVRGDKLHVETIAGDIHLTLVQAAMQQYRATFVRRLRPDDYERLAQIARREPVPRDPLTARLLYYRYALEL